VSCSCQSLWYERMYALACCKNSRTRSVVITSLEKHFLTVQQKFSLPLLSFRGCRWYQFLAQPQAYSIPSPTSSQWHFGVWSMNMPISVAFSWSIVSCPWKSLRF
jgi:hypothetical protein